MSADISAGTMSLESQLLSIMDVLVKAAVSEISQLFSENSSSLRLHLSQSLRENEALRTRMKVMRSEVFSLRLQTRNNRPASRFSTVRGNVPKPRPKPQEQRFRATGPAAPGESQTSAETLHTPDTVCSPHCHRESTTAPFVVKSPAAQKKAVSISSPAEKETTSPTQCAEEESPDVILIKDEDDGGCEAAADQEDFVNSGTQRWGATGNLQPTGSSCMTENNAELRIVSVHGRGEGPLQEENTLFNISQLQAFSSLSPDNNAARDNLLDFTLGSNDRAPIRSMQDDSAARNNQLDGINSIQMSSAVGADGQTGHLGHVQMFPQMQNAFAQGINKSLDCTFCGERFSSREDLIVHRASHTGESPVSCSFCGKTFVKKTTLSIHMRIHTGEKPYSCTQCGKRFTQNGSLKIHLRTHSGEKPYTCNQCSASFNNPSNLRRHMITHSGGL